MRREKYATKLNWERVRPGLYQLMIAKEGSAMSRRRAVIERGAETGDWWWIRANGKAGREKTLKLAKAIAQADRFAP